MGHQDIHQQSRAVAICIWSEIEDKETLDTLLQTVKSFRLDFSGQVMKPAMTTYSVQTTLVEKIYKVFLNYLMLFLQL